LKLFSVIKKSKDIHHKGTKARRRDMNFKSLSKREESIAEKIVDTAYIVRKISGPGLLERVYEVC